MNTDGLDGMRAKRDLVFRVNRRDFLKRGGLALAGLAVLRPLGANAGESENRSMIIQQNGASLAEQTAARELAAYLHLTTGVAFDVQVATDKKIPEQAIIVGLGPVTQALFPQAVIEKLGPEEFVMYTMGQRLLLAGGQPRGTLYAVYHFLQEQCGVRWWVPWATDVPQHAPFRIPNMNVRKKPAFEYREPYWFDGFNSYWKARNGANGANCGSPAIPAKLGGCIRYVGFVHTFYWLVPPDKYFAKHPDWYSLINGKRTFRCMGRQDAQLCLSNPQLRKFVVRRVEELLRESPDASIISVSQNDVNGGECQCSKCRAIDQAQGSPSGSIIAFVNYIAKKIAPEFPKVAVDTLAYQYSRKPPKTLRPRPNVIVRLCSIECNFREPLDHPTNASFLNDLEGWSKICHRLYIWNYSTDFSNYVLPFPNWFTLGPNIRIFQKFGVKGVYEEGAYQGYGAEMGELRTWLLAQLLWDPQQNDRALIQEFLEGYYGKAAAKPIRNYLDLMHDASKGFYLTCYMPSTAPILTFKVLAKAERLWQEAEEATGSDPGKRARVRIGHLPVWYAFLRNWGKLRQQCREQKAVWPLSPSRKVVADHFGRVCKGVPGKDWTRVHVLSEGGVSVEEFLRNFQSTL